MSRLSEATKTQMYQHAQDVIELEKEHRAAESKGCNRDPSPICRLYDISDSMFCATRIKSLIDELREKDRQLEALKGAKPSSETQFKPVSDLYALKTLAGQTYSYTASPHEAEQWLGTEGYSVQEYVKLERLQQAVTAPPAQGGTDYKAIVERIAEILHGKVTDIDLLTVTVQAMKERNSKLERQAIQPLPIGELLKRLEEQTGEPWSKAYLAGINLETGVKRERRTGR